MKKFWNLVKSAFFGTLLFVARTIWYIVGIFLGLTAISILGFVSLDLLTDIFHQLMYEVSRH